MVKRRIIVSRAAVPVVRSSELASLHREIWERVPQVRPSAVTHFYEPRMWVPHITLARMARSAGSGAEVERCLFRHAGLSSAPFTCAHLVLYESRLGRDGARYEPVERWPLAG